jgi:signal transduction histidine kinase
MRTRAERLGGRFEIEAAPDRGTRVTAVIPTSVEAAPAAPE